MSDDRRELERLLRQRNEHPERLAEIDRQVRERFTRQLAVLVLDMTGFSRLTHRYGIVHFLAMIARMHDLVLPLVRDGRHGGRTVKLEADNVIAVFPEATDAVAAAFAIQSVLAEANRVLPDDWDIHASIGIGHGDLLIVGDDDLYGHEMNLASKLGEDTGESGDVLLTEAAFHQLPSGHYHAQRLAGLISGLSFSYYKVTGRAS